MVRSWALTGSGHSDLNTSKPSKKKANPYNPVQHLSHLPCFTENLLERLLHTFCVTIHPSTLADWLTTLPPHWIWPSLEYNIAMSVGFFSTFCGTGHIDHTLLENIFSFEFWLVIFPLTLIFNPSLPIWRFTTSYLVLPCSYLKWPYLLWFSSWTSALLFCTLSVGIFIHNCLHTYDPHIPLTDLTLLGSSPVYPMT